MLTAIFLEATCLGIMLFGIGRVSERTPTIATLLVAGGTTLSAFWIPVRNFWMQAPAGHELRDGVVHAVDWAAIVFNPSMPYRVTHVLLGATWLLVKGEGDLQRRAIDWAQRALWLTAAGIGAVSIVTPLVSRRIFDKWFALPEFVLLLPVPVATLTLLWVIVRSLQGLPVRLAQGNEYGVRVPFGCAIVLYSVFAHRIFGAKARALDYG